jgi:hypothetical protein
MMRIARSAILRLLNEVDVEGLLQAGAPSDEYAGEARDIAAAIAALAPGEFDETHMLQIVSSVCCQSFGPFDADQLSRRQPVYRHVAYRILEMRQGA